MVTVLKEIQNVLNNRPLTYVYTDNFNEVLTPNKLLYGRNIYNELNFDGDMIEVANPIEQVRKIRKLLDQFWRLWQNEYLLELREHDKLKKSKGNASPNFRGHSANQR